MQMRHCPLRRSLGERAGSVNHGGHLLRVALLLVSVAALGALWRWTSFADWATPERLSALAAPLRTSASGPIIAAAGIVAGGFVLVPVTAMILACIYLFGPMLGFGAAFAGSLASAIVGFALGRVLLGNWVRGLRSPRLHRVRNRLARSGIVAIAAIRIVPIAPFTIVNVVAGASSVGFRDYLIGSAIGLAPGILAMTVLADRAAQAVLDPGLDAFSVFVALALCVWLLLRLARRRLGESGGV